MSDHDDIRAGVRRVCADFPDAYWRRCDAAHEFPWEFHEAMAAGGWIGVAMPESLGGGGRGTAEAAVVVEEIAASGAAMNGASAIHMSIFGLMPLVRHDPELAARYVPDVVAGRLHVAFGVTEPDAGTDTSAITTRAHLDGDHWVVRGRKVWTSKATVCQKVLLLVRTAPAPPGGRPTDGLTLLFADLTDPAVTISPIDKLGRNAVASCEVAYDDLRVPADHVVGEAGQGFRYLLDGLNPERILIAAEAIGIGRAALARAAAYARDRVVFGRPIGANQGIAFPLAQAHAQLHAASLVVADAAARFDAGLPCGEQANMAKLLAADAAFFAADRAVQTHGGYGYATEYDVARYWKEARLMQLAPVPQEMVLNFLATHALGLPKSY